MSESTALNIPLLDQGYLRLIETWGSDERIIEAARMSTDKGFLGWGPKECPNEECVNGLEPRGGAMQECLSCKGKGHVDGDERLLRRLWLDKHATPFEMGGLVFEVQAPIFVFREWHRHRTQSYNELSARYTALPDMYYVPSIERLMSAKQSTKNKQGSEAGFTQVQAEMTQGLLKESYVKARAYYEDMLASGVSREIARLVVPVAQYSRMRASANLRNWLGFLALRMAPDAQWEIRQYADAMGTVVEGTFPRTWELFKGGR